MEDNESPDVRGIRALIERQFKSLSWADGRRPDLTGFAADFTPDALLHPSLRPLRPQSIRQFSDRMASLAGTTLRSFEETVLASTVHVYGNVAVAVVACSNVENATETSRNVEMMLLVKDQGRWRIAAQAWDKDNPADPVTGLFP